MKQIVKKFTFDIIGLYSMKFRGPLAVSKGHKIDNNNGILGIHKIRMRSNQIDLDMNDLDIIDK